MPFIAVTPFDRRTRINVGRLIANAAQSPQNIPTDEKPDEYEEYKLEQIYYIITSNGIEVKNKLTPSQRNILKQGGTVLKKTPGGAEVTSIDFFSIPIEIENVGNGTAVNLRIGFNRSTDKPHKFIRPMMLKQNQALYIHIFSTAAFDIVNGEYELEFYYEDIYRNKYLQKFPVCFGCNDNGAEYQSITLVGEQLKYEGKIPGKFE